MVTKVTHTLKNIYKKDNGFSLIEVIIAVAILGIFFVSFYPFMMNSINIAHDNLYKAEAIQLARSQIQNAQSSLSGSLCNEDLIPSIDINSNVYISSTTLNCPGADNEIADYTVIVSREDNNEEIYELTTSILVLVN